MSYEPEPMIGSSSTSESPEDEVLTFHKSMNRDIWP
jgi:hypothetical protein